jgi:hypothetical protein
MGKGVGTPNGPYMGLLSLSTLRVPVQSPCRDTFMGRALSKTSSPAPTVSYMETDPFTGSPHMIPQEVPEGLWPHGFTVTVTVIVTVTVTVAGTVTVMVTVICATDYGFWGLCQNTALIHAMLRA